MNRERLWILCTVAFPTATRVHVAGTCSDHTVAARGAAITGSIVTPPTPARRPACTRGHALRDPQGGLQTAQMSAIYCGRHSIVEDKNAALQQYRRS
jgi:hypothetical protein